MDLYFRETVTVCVTFEICEAVTVWTIGVFVTVACFNAVLTLSCLNLFMPIDPCFG